MKACAYLNAVVAAGASLAAMFAGCGGTQAQAGSPVANAAEEPEAAASPDEQPAPFEAAQGGEPTPARGGAGDARSTESIANLVKSRRDEARACYDGLQREKKLPAGDLVVHFVLKPDGTVKETSLNAQRSTLKDPELLECVSQVIQSIRFPASSRGMETSVNYPFNFNPRGR